MKRIILVIALALMASGVAPAQTAAGTEITGEQKNALVTAIDKAHRQLGTLSANFTQEKTSALFTDKVVQKGKLMYKSPKQLRWEYTSPKAMTVIFSNGKVTLVTDKGAAANPNKMLSEMGNLIINTINGTFLKDNPDFSAKYYKDKSGNVTAVLTPLSKRIKTYYQNISITLNGSSHLADRVTLNEASGDVTTIIFSDKRTNPPLSDTLFK